MSNLDKIKRLSKLVKFICVVLLLIIPIIDAIFWIFCTPVIENIPAQTRAQQKSPDTNTYLTWQIPNMPIGFTKTNNLFSSLNKTTLSSKERLFGFISDLLPMLINMFLIAILISLFKLYASGIIFTMENVRCYQYLGWLLILKPFIISLYDSLLYSLANYPGFSIGFGNDIVATFTGLVVLIISWVMAQGYKIEEEQAYTI